MKTGVTYEFEAWAEGTSTAGKGKPTYRQTYVFDSAAEAVAERDRLEQMWADRLPRERYIFDVYRIEKVIVSR